MGQKTKDKKYFNSKLITYIIIGLILGTLIFATTSRLLFQLSKESTTQNPENNSELTSPEYKIQDLQIGGGEISATEQEEVE